MIQSHALDIDEIVVTLDTHHPDHIAHARCWYCDSEAHIPKIQPPPVECTIPDCPYVLNPQRYIRKKHWHPASFTEISYPSVYMGIWKPFIELQDSNWCVEYTRHLDMNNRPRLTIWPEHCIRRLNGEFTEGHKIFPVIQDAIDGWKLATKREPVLVHKSYSKATEMYSALVAEKLDPERRDSALNQSLLVRLRLAERVVVCGEALSHCVNYTMRDIVEYLHQDPKKIVLLKDGECGSTLTFTRVDSIPSLSSSPLSRLRLSHVTVIYCCSSGCSTIAGHELTVEKLLADMTNEGVQIQHCNEVFLTAKDC